MTLNLESLALENRNRDRREKGKRKKAFCSQEESNDYSVFRQRLPQTAQAPHKEVMRSSPCGNQAVVPDTVKAVHDGEPINGDNEKAAGGRR